MRNVFLSARSPGNQVHSNMGNRSEPGFVLRFAGRAVPKNTIARIPHVGVGCGLSLLSIVGFGVIGEMRLPMEKTGTARA
jgi:hypothetical protein